MQNQGHAPRLHQGHSTPSQEPFPFLAGAGASLGSLLAGLCLSACGGGGGGGELVDQAPSQIGAPNTKPGQSGLVNGALYLVDPHQGGLGDSVRIVDLFWGRLVDVYAQAPGVVEPSLVYPDLVIGDDVRSEVGKWTLSSNPITGRELLVILRENTGDPADDFDLLVQEAQANLGPVLPKGLALNEAPPFSFIARNSALVIQFDDLIDADSLSLNDSVRLSVGNPPITPFDVRLFPDPSHGGISPVDGQFHSSRLILDMAISSSELLLLEQPLQSSGAGLPPAVDTQKANVALRFPTAIDPSVGQFKRLVNLKGRPLATASNGPIDQSKSTQDVVRAMRSGNSSDVNNGFLSDLEGPRILGRQGVTVSSAVPLTGGQPGYDFVIGFSFLNPTCASSPVVGDVIQIGNQLQLEVVQAGASSQGSVAGLRVRAPQSGEPRTPSELLGAGLMITPWRPSLAPLGLAPCFVRFSPNPTLPPNAGITPETVISVEFSEAIDPLSVRPLDSLTVRNKPNSSGFRDFVVGEVFASTDLREFRFTPLLPLTHQQGTAEVYFVDLLSGVGTGGITDLAGNALQSVLPQVSFGLTAGAPSNRTGGLALRFNAVSEDDNPGVDLRGQFLYNLAQGQIRPRPFSRYSAVIDRTVPIIGRMAPVQTGLQTPLSNLGSRLHLMWRYCDMGLPSEQNQEDIFTNIDIAGLSLSPLTGSVTATFYPQFEMLLGHSDRMPDEITNQSNDPTYPNSGFVTSSPFSQNYLADPLNVPAIVHPRELGYLVAASEVFTSTTGTPMVFFPMNRNLPIENHRYYTWRDTALQAWGNRTPSGNDITNAGVPITWDVIFNGGAVPGDVGNEYGGDNAPNKIIPTGLPSVTLPILMEFRCYPGESLSVNNFDCSIASTSNIRPFYRAFSTGGFNTQGQPVIKDPDNEPIPTGGFNGNPNLQQLGSPTPGQDPTVYLGQLELVNRIARAHTVLLDSQQANPDYAGVVIEPRANLQPFGTQVVLAFRGDDKPNLAPTSQYLDATQMDVYGEPLNATNATILTNPTWSDSISANDGNRYIQVRVTFILNPITQLAPVLSGLGLAWRF